MKKTHAIYNETSPPTLSEVGPYRRSPYIMTTTAASVTPFALERGGDNIAATVTLCFPDGQNIPDWAQLDFEDAGIGRIEVGGAPCRLFTKHFPDGVVRPGPNVAGSRYFIIVEPGWWSMGEEAEDLIFYPPVNYLGSDTGPDGNKNGTWEDVDDGTVDGIWSGGVPRYIDIRLRISDPDYVGQGASPGVRTFCERVAIPAGVEP